MKLGRLRGSPRPQAARPYKVLDRSFSPKTRFHCEVSQIAPRGICLGYALDWFIQSAELELSTSIPTELKTCHE